VPYSLNNMDGNAETMCSTCSTIILMLIFYVIYLIPFIVSSGVIAVGILAAFGTGLVQHLADVVLSWSGFRGLQ
jgi:hypothetical protein